MMERNRGQTQSAGRAGLVMERDPSGGVVTPKSEGPLWSAQMSSGRALARQGSGYELRTAVLIFSAVFAEPARPWGGWEAASSPENALY